MLIRKDTKGGNWADTIGFEYALQIHYDRAVAEDRNAISVYPAFLAQLICAYDDLQKRVAQIMEMSLNFQKTADEAVMSARGTQNKLIETEGALIITKGNLSHVERKLKEADGHCAVLRHAKAIYESNAESMQATIIRKNSEIGALRSDMAEDAAIKESLRNDNANLRRTVRTLEKALSALPTSASAREIADLKQRIANDAEQLKHAWKLMDRYEDMIEKLTRGRDLALRQPRPNRFQSPVSPQAFDSHGWAG